MGHIERRSEALIRFHCEVPFVDADGGIFVQDTEEFIGNFRNFRYIDQFLYSYEYLADFRSKESIDLYRISPEDANRGYGTGRGLADKLAGDQFRAFGGFFKKSWRSNDILWGRLDGLNRLVDALLTPESLQNFQGFVQRQCQVNAEGCASDLDQYLSSLVKESFPSTEPPDALLLTYLKKLAEHGAQSMGEDELNRFLNHLVTLGHREIVNSDLENVWNDDLEEQLKWEVIRKVTSDEDKKPDQDTENDQDKNTASTGSKKPTKVTYDPTTQTYNSLLTSVVVQSMVKAAIQEIGSKETFFQLQYRVGSETLVKSVPAIVLKNLMARTGLLLRDMCLADLEDPKAIKKLGVFQGINRGLQLFYVLVNRRSPTSLKQTSKVSLINPGFILLVITLTGLVVLASSIAAILLKLPPWGLPAIAALVVLTGLILLIGSGSKD